MRVEEGDASMREGPERQSRGAEVHRNHPTPTPQLLVGLVQEPGEDAVHAPLRMPRRSEDPRALLRRTNRNRSR